MICIIILTLTPPLFNAQYLVYHFLQIIPSVFLQSSRLNGDLYMKIKLIRFTALLCALLTLSSCAYLPERPDNETGTLSTDGVTEDTEENSADTEKVEDETLYLYTGDPDNPLLAEAYLASLPSHDFNGATVIITSPDTAFFDENEVRFLSDTVRARNEAVEAKFNVNVECTLTSSETMIEEAKKASLSGMYYTDVMCVPFEDVGVFDTQNLLMNLRSLPYLDLSAAYFNQSSVSALTAGDKVLGVAGEATPATDLPCIIYNKTLAEATGITGLYDTALAGGFTWDVFFQYVALGDALSGVSGAAVSDEAYYDSILASSGETAVSTAVGKTPSVALTSKSLDLSSAYVKTMLASASSEGITKETAAEAFKNGKVLFTVGTLGSLDTYRTSALSTGILPMPKQSTEQDYVTKVPSDALVMCVPAGTTKCELTSLVLSALNAASYGIITEKNASYLHVNTLPDNRSADVVEVISRSVTYDFLTAFEKDVPALTDFKNAVRKAQETGNFTDFNKTSQALKTALARRFPVYR